MSMDAGQGHNSPAAAPAPVPMSANEPHEDHEASLDQRANDLADALNAEQREADLLEGDGGDNDELQAARALLFADKVAPAAKAAPVVEKTDVEKARQASLDRVAEMERKSVKISRQQSEKDRDQAAKDTALAKRETELAKLEHVFNEPEALLEYLHDKVGAEKLSNWLMEQANPERRIEAKAKSIESQVEERLRAAEERMEAREKAIEQREQNAMRTKARAENEGKFVTRIGEMAEETPYLARLMAKRPQDAIKMGHTVAESLASSNQSVTFDQVIREIESQLSEYADVYGPQNPGPALQGRPEHRSPSAAAKAPSLNNRAAAERTSIASEDEEFSNLSIDERARRLERTLRTQR